MNQYTYQYLIHTCPVWMHYAGNLYCHLSLRMHEIFIAIFPVNMPLVASTGPVLVRCCQHRPSTGPVLAHNCMFIGFYLENVGFLEYFCSRTKSQAELCMKSCVQGIALNIWGYISGNYYVESLSIFIDLFGSKEDILLY